MVDDEKYCVGLITQSLAIWNAFGSIEDLMLENHLAAHV